jgi:hypothetical protein
MRGPQPGRRLRRLERQLVREVQLGASDRGRRRSSLQPGGPCFPNPVLARIELKDEHRLLGKSQRTRPAQ